jgi:hypothetical protein
LFKAAFLASILSSVINLIFITLAVNLAALEPEVIEYFFYVVLITSICELGVVDYFSRAKNSGYRLNRSAHYSLIFSLCLIFSVVMDWDLAGFGYVLIYSVLSFEFRILFGVAQAEGIKRNILFSQIATQLIKFVLLGLYLILNDFQDAILITQIVYFFIFLNMYYLNSQGVVWDHRFSGYLVELSKNMKVNFASIVMQRFDVLLLMILGSVEDSVMYFAIASYAMGYQLVSRALVTKILATRIKSEIRPFMDKSDLKVFLFILSNLILLVLFAPDILSLLIDSYNDSFDLVVLFVFSQHLFGIYFARYEGFFLKFNPYVVFLAKCLSIFGLIVFVLMLNLTYVLDATSIAIVFLLSRCVGWFYLFYKYRVSHEFI